MKYNFDEEVNRSNNNAAKFEEAHLHYSTNEVIPLWIADMDFVTAKPIVDAIVERANQGIFGYTNRPDEYFEAIAEWQNKRNNWKANTNHMAFAPGVVPGMKIIIENFTDIGDKVIIQNPVYHPFTDIVVNSGRTLLVSTLIKNDDKYVMDYDDFEEKAKEGAKYFILCNPHNPVGRVWTKEELKKIGDICVKYNIKVISDEIHSDLMLFGNKHIPFASISDEINNITITCIAPSKTFNLAGLQSSTIIFPNVDMKDKYISELKMMDIARNNCFSIVATIAAYKHGEKWLEQLIGYLEENMIFINEYCKNNIPKLKPSCPQGTYLCWVDARELNMSDEELKRFMVDKAKVGVSMGIGFGKEGEGFFRINAACPRSVLERALNNMKDAIDSI